MLTSDERKYLKFLVEKELGEFKKLQKTVALDSAVPFLKAEHETQHFLEKLLEKLK